MKKLALLLTLALMAPSAAAQSTTQKAKIIKKLNSMAISVDFKEASLEDAIDFLREITSINFFIDPVVEEEFSRDDLTITLRVKDLKLKSVLKLLGL